MFSFLPLINNSVTNGLIFLLLRISAIISSKTISISLYFSLQCFDKYHSCYLSIQ